jgi:hypothetical protein
MAEGECSCTGPAFEDKNLDVDVDTRLVRNNMLKE